MLGETLSELLQELGEPSEFERAADELNSGYFITSVLEDDFLYHTTYWQRLKSILLDGFLSGNPQYLASKGVRMKHANVVSFTSSKWRHLSDLPGIAGLTHDCYLKIPYDALKDVVKPVIYKLSRRELEELLKGDGAHYLSTLTQNEEKLRREYGGDYPLYLYNTWFEEQEWRVKADRVHLPAETEVYVSSYYQLQKAKTLTDLPVYLDREIMLLKNISNFERNTVKRLLRIIGIDFYRHGVSHIAVHTNPVQTPDGGETSFHATLCDVRYLHAITIVKRLKNAGLQVWAEGRPWKHRPYATLKVDLTFLYKKKPLAVRDRMPKRRREAAP